MQQWYRIGDIEKLTGISQRTLRSWEIRHNLIQPHRTPKGTRLYSERDLQAIRSIMSIIYSRKLSLRAIAAEVAAGRLALADLTTDLAYQIPSPKKGLIQNSVETSQIIRRAADPISLASRSHPLYKDFSGTLSKVLGEIEEYSRLSEFSNYLCKEVRALFSASGVYLWLLEENGQWLDGSAFYGQESPYFIGFRLPVDHTTAHAARAFRANEPVIVNKTRENIGLVPFQSTLRIASLMALPLFTAKNTAIGVLTVLDLDNDIKFPAKPERESEQLEDYSYNMNDYENYLDRLKLFCTNLAGSIAIVKTIEERADTISYQQKLLSDILFLNKSFLVNDVLKQIIISCCTMVRSDVGFAFVVKGNEKILSGMSGRLASKERKGIQPYEFTPENISFNEHSVGVKSMKDRKVIAIEDAIDNPDVNREMRVKYNVRALLAVPLIVENRVAGVFLLGDTRRRRKFTLQEIEKCKEFASYAALALHYALLLESKDREDKILH